MPITGADNFVKAYNERQEEERLAQRITGVGTSQLVNKKARLRWLRHAECKDDTEWVKHCMEVEINGTRQRKRW